MTREEYQALRLERPELKLVAWESYQEWVWDALKPLTREDIITRAVVSCFKNEGLWEWIWLCELLEPEAV